MFRRTAFLPADVDWGSWPSLFTAVEVWRPAVEHVARNLNLTLDVTRIVAGYPGTCAVFVVDHAVVLKFFPPFLAGDYGREVAVYRFIDGTNLLQPGNLAAGTLHDRLDWPYLALAYCEGQAWRDTRLILSDRDRLGVAKLLGHIIRRLHTLPIHQGTHWPQPESWAALVQERLPHIAIDLDEQTALPSAVREAAVSLASRTDWTACPVLLHGDLTEDHLLLQPDGEGWKPVALIDWADAEVGDPAYDWIALWFSFCQRDARLFRAFMRGYGQVKAAGTVFVRRLLAFTLLHRFGARIIADVVPAAMQSTVSSLEDLEQLLFGPLLKRGR